MVENGQSHTKVESTTETTSTSTSQESTNDPFYRLSFKVGVAENKNGTFRNKMEDVHTYIANFAEMIDWGYFAIFDGHAGKDTARWCGNNLHTLLEHEIDLELNSNNTPNTKTETESKTETETETESKSTDSSDNSNDTNAKNNDDTITNNTNNANTNTNTNSNTNDNNDTNDIQQKSGFDMQESLFKSFIKADELIEKEGVGSSGSTAAVAVLRWELHDDQGIDISSTSSNSKNPQYEFIPTKNHKRMLYTSNVGDSRIVLCRGGQPYRLSYDHKATDINEINRIKESNGLIMKNRVNGVLAVTRSLGDSYMKDLVIGKPFTTSTEITDSDDFIILACDGVWDVISDLRACNFVLEQFNKENADDPQKVAKKLCQLAMDNSTTDNVTVMIVKFDKDIFDQKEVEVELTK